MTESYRLATRLVGVADCGVSADINDSFTAYALGSCIAVTAYDPIARVGGLLHFLLPEQTADAGRGRDNPFVCADTGIPELIDRCVRSGAVKRRLRVYAAGGASVVKDAAMFDVGRRNHLSLRRVLWKAGLLLQGEAIGGDCWRNVRLELATGKVWVKEGSLPDMELSAGSFKRQERQQ
ncbi:MAG TPA: chemotaxis protein CheD [Bryobacteraceae bacterium]|nr:chemotaxis protein CheD [Bryobacteraceae bacterium]